MGDERSAGSILVAVNALRRLSTGELREKYAEVFGEPTSSRNRDYLLRKIAAELQGPCDDTPPVTEESSDAKPAPASAPRRRPSGARDPRLPPPGTVLERAHDGSVVRVTVLEDGFEYGGQTYRSLSAVARAATGTAWNGLLFFRLIPCRHETPSPARSR
jgi:hypothetical protein